MEDKNIKRKSHAASPIASKVLLSTRAPRPFSLNSMKREEEKEKEIRIEKMSKLYTMDWVSFSKGSKKSTCRDKVKKGESPRG